MRGISGENNNYNIQPLTSWLGNTKHHLSQLGKGILVGGLTLGGYGLWRQWWKGDATPQEMSSEKSAIATSVSQTEVAKVDLLKQPVSTELSTANIRRTTSPEDALPISETQVLPVESSKSLQNDLDISFHEKPAPSEDSPPYGVLRLIYQVKNVPGGWYPTIIRLCQLAEQAMTDSTKLTELQNTLQQQKDWCVVYEGVGLLGKVARTTQDEKIRKQAIEQSPSAGLRYYETHPTFWSRCCAGKSPWIHARATVEVQSLTPEDFDADAQGNSNAQQQLRVPLLERTRTLAV